MAAAKVAGPPAVVTVSLAVPMLFETEVPATVHVGAGVTTGAMEHVRAASNTSNPLAGMILMSDVADEPGATEDGDNAATESVKPAVTDTVFDVLSPKLPSPL